MRKYEGAQKAAQLPETSQQLDIEHQKEHVGSNSNSNFSLSMGTTSNPTILSLPQQETRTQDGRRKITPQFVGSMSSVGTNSMSAFQMSQPFTSSSPSFDGPKVAPKRRASQDNSTSVAGASSSSSPAAKKPRTGENADDSDAEEKPQKAAPRPVTMPLTVSSSSSPSAAAKGKQPATPAPSASPSQNKARPKAVGDLVIGVPAGPENTLHLELASRLDLSGKAPIVLEANNQYKGIGGKGSQLVCSQGENRRWAAVLPKAVLHLAGNEFFSAAACQQGELYIFSAAGRRLFPCIQLDSPSAAISASGPFLANVSGSGLLSLWNIRLQTCVLNGERLSFLSAVEANFQEVYVSPKGVPVITLDNNTSYTFDFAMKVWIRVADNDFDLSDFRKTLKSNSGILGAFQSRVPINPADFLRTMDSAGQDLRRAVSTAHLESQVASAVALKSSQEAADWLRTYTKRLAEENAEDKLREVFKSLLGPPGPSVAPPQAPGPEWNPMLIVSFSRLFFWKPRRDTLSLSFLFLFLSFLFFSRTSKSENC